MICDFDDLTLGLGFKDVTAENIFPSDGPASFEPIQTYGDGNCLYRAMSRVLCGTEDMHVELRVRTFMELCLKKDLYFDDTYLKTLTGLDNCKEWLLDSSFDTSSVSKGVDKVKRQQLGFEAGVISTIKPSKYSNMWHIFALSNVTGCSITSVYPEVRGSLVNRQYMNVTIVPEKVRQSGVAYLMWTHMNNTNLHGWSPNHFVPLMPAVTAAQVPLQSPKPPTSDQSANIPSVSPSSQVPKAAQKRKYTVDQSTKDAKKSTKALSCTIHIFRHHGLSNGHALLPAASLTAIYFALCAKEHFHVLSKVFAT